MQKMKRIVHFVKKMNLSKLKKNSIFKIEFILITVIILNIRCVGSDKCIPEKWHCDQYEGNSIISISFLCNISF